jgi:hypothetical protein
MSNGGSYYALIVKQDAASMAAYYSLKPKSNLEFSQGGVTMKPTALAPTTVNILPSRVEIQAPPGSLNASVIVITSEDLIEGDLVVSPPVNVPVAVTLYGAGGKQLGQEILDPGAESLKFSWPVSSWKPIPKDDVLSVLQSLLPKAK